MLCFFLEIKCFLCSLIKPKIDNEQDVVVHAREMALEFENQNESKNRLLYFGFDSY